MELDDINRAITLLQNKLNDKVFDFNNDIIDPNKTYKFIKRKRKNENSSEDKVIFSHRKNNNTIVKSDKTQKNNVFDKILDDEQLIIKTIETKVKSLGLNID